MTEPIVRTPREAELLATVASRVVEGGMVNGPARDLLRLIHARCRADGPLLGSADGTEEVAVSDDLVDVTTASGALGLTPRAVRKRCSTGRMPGALQIGGVWLIPASVLPADEEHHGPQDTAA